MSVAATAGTTAWSTVAPVVEAISQVAGTVSDVFSASITTPARWPGSATSGDDSDPTGAASGTVATKSLVIPPAHSIQAHDPTSGQTIAVAQDAEEGSVNVEATPTSGEPSKPLPPGVLPPTVLIYVMATKPAPSELEQALASIGVTELEWTNAETNVARSASSDAWHEVYASLANDHRSVLPELQAATASLQWSPVDEVPRRQALNQERLERLWATALEAVADNDPSSARAALAQLDAELGYHPEHGPGSAAADQLVDALAEPWLSSEEQTRIGGGMRMAFGLGEVVVGYAFAVAFSPTLVGSMVGGAVAFHGLDEYTTGWRELWSGVPDQTLTASSIGDITGWPELGTAVAQGLQALSVAAGGGAYAVRNIDDAAAIGIIELRVGPNSSRRRLFANASETGTTRLPIGEGETDKFGNVLYSTLGSADDVALARYHESVHSFLSPKFKLFRELRADFGMAAYNRSSTLRYIEEALAESYAQLRVNGIRGLPTGTKFPIKEGYVTIQALAAEGAVGTVVIGGVTYYVFHDSE